MKKNNNGEDLIKLIDEASSNPNARRNVMQMFGFILHPVFSIYIIIYLILNFLSSSIVIGFSTIGSPIIDITIVGFFIGIILYTLIEIPIKLLLLRYFIKQVIYSFGLLLYLVYIGVNFLISIIIPSGEFSFTSSGNLFLYTLFFMIIRFILSRLVLRTNWIQQLGGRKK